MGREVKIIDNANELTILIPRSGHWLILFVTGTWCLLWLGIFYNLAVEGMFFRDSGFIILLSVFMIVWLFVFKIFLWHLRGTEKISMDHEHLRIARLGTFFTSTTKFELHLIDDFHYAETNNIPWWSKLYGFAGGYISFEYWDRPEFFGQTVAKKDAREIIAKLNDRLKIVHEQAELTLDQSDD